MGISEWEENRDIRKRGSGGVLRIKFVDIIIWVYIWLGIFLDIYVIFLKCFVLEEKCLNYTFIWWERIVYVYILDVCGGMFLNCS